MKRKHTILGKIVEFESPFKFYIHDGYIHFETRKLIGCFNIDKPDFWQWMHFNGFEISDL